MLDCPASDQSGTGMKKLSMPGQSGIGPSQSSPAFFGSGTGLKLLMPMPALVSWMPMPSYGEMYVGVYAG
jgi:hypothetical protein